MKMLAKWALMFCLAAWAASAAAQQVRVVLNVSPPYPTHLEDALKFSPQTIVTVTNLSGANQQVKLLASVTGDNGASGKVKTSFTPAAPIILNPFETRVLTGSQLRAINANLTENDVDIQGVDIQRLVQTETIPEGMYTVCVRAYDYQNSAPLSAEMSACVPIYVTHFDPPIVIAPSAGEAVAAINPQFLNLIWTPAGIGGKTRYRLEMADMTLNNLLNANEAFDNPAIFTFKKEGLLTTSFVYDMAQPALAKNHRYALRITAYDPTQELAFKNGGKSPVSTFTWKGNAQIIVNPFDPPNVDIADNPGGNPPVPPGPGNVQNQPPPKLYNTLPCMSLPNLANKTPINGAGTIGPETILKMGDHNLRLTENIVWNGTKLSGWGLITNVWFKIPVKVQFADLQVNSDKVVIDGLAYARDDNNSPVEWLNDLTQISLGEQQIQNAIQKLMGDSDKRIVEWPNTKNIGVGMPVGIRRNIGGAQQLVAIVGMVFGPGGSGLNAICQINLPASGQKLNLAAAGVCFTAQGLTKDAFLYLAEDFTVGPNSATRLILKKGYANDPSKGTFVLMQKEGFKNMQVDGLLRLDNQRVVPVDKQKEYVEAPFKITVDNFHNFMLDGLTITPFEVKGLKDWQFSITSLSYDHSDLQNPTGIEFPKANYNTEGALWQGLYFKQLKIKIPEKLQKGSEIAASKMVFDKFGFSGIISAPLVFGKETGKMGDKKWKFSLENLYVRVIKNGFEEGKFNGEIRLPVAREDRYLKYDAWLSNQDDDLKYQFKIQTDTITFPAVIAKATMFPETHIIVADMGNGFDPAFHLYGKLTLNTSLGLNVQGYDLSFEGVEVKDLMVDKTGIHLGPQGDVKYTSPQKKIAGFDASITGDEIGLNSIGLTIGIQFTGEKNCVGGATSFHILTKWGGDNMMAFDGFQLDKVTIHGDMSVVHVDGSLVFYYDDPVYGRGFKGDIAADIKIGEGGGIGLAMELLVGNKNGLKYFYFDGQVDPLPIEVPITASLRFFGFRGGVYHHMKRTGEGTYIPDAATVFGIKAGVSMGLVKKEAFHAKVTLEASFTSSGLAMLALYGDGYMFTKYQSGFDPYPGPLPLHLGVSVEFDFVQKIFDLHASIDINYPVQAPLIEGSGEMQVYVAGAQDWFVKIGTPSKRVTLNIIKIIETGHYFMAGYGLEGMPLPPPEVMEICKIDPKQLAGSRAADITDDKNLGFAFGAEYHIGTGDLKFLFFFASFDLWAGFDVMLRKQDVCDGMNGWYANGQMYAAFKGDVGLFFKFCKSCQERKIHLLLLQAGALAQVGLANPTWVEAYVAGKAEFLGLIKGEFDFHVAFGDKCEFKPDLSKPALDGLVYIKDTNPKAGDKDVSVFAEPQVALTFSTKEDKVYKLDEVDSEGNKTARYFRFPLQELRLRETKSGGKILATYPNSNVGSWKSNFAGDVFTYKSAAVLPANQELAMDIGVRVLEKTGGSWVEITGIDEAKETVKFSTGSEPKKLTDDLVAYAVPERRQRYFLQDEPSGRVGFIETTKQLNEMFDLKGNTPLNADKIRVKFIPIGGGSVQEGEYLGYTGKRVRFRYPANLQNDRLYILQLLKVSSPSEFLQNAPQEPQGFGQMNFAANTSLEEEMTSKQKVLGDLRLAPREYELYKYAFRTSHYDNLAAKIAPMQIGSVDNPPGSEPNISRIVTAKATERFDKTDVAHIHFNWSLGYDPGGGSGGGGGDSNGNNYEDPLQNNVFTNQYWATYLDPQVYKAYNQTLRLFAYPGLPTLEPVTYMVLKDAEPSLSQAEIDAALQANLFNPQNTLNSNPTATKEVKFYFFGEGVAYLHWKNELMPRLFNGSNPVISACLQNKPGCNQAIRQLQLYHMGTKFKKLFPAEQRTHAAMNAAFGIYPAKAIYDQPTFKWK